MRRIIQYTAIVFLFAFIYASFAAEASAQVRSPVNRTTRPANPIAFENHCRVSVFSKTASSAPVEPGFYDCIIALEALADVESQDLVVIDSVELVYSSVKEIAARDLQDFKRDGTRRHRVLVTRSIESPVVTLVENGPPFRASETGIKLAQGDHLYINRIVPRSYGDSVYVVVLDAGSIAWKSDEIHLNER